MLLGEEFLDTLGVGTPMGAAGWGKQVFHGSQYTHGCCCGRREAQLLWGSWSTRGCCWEGRGCFFLPLRWRETKAGRLWRGGGWYLGAPIPPDVHVSVPGPDSPVSPQKERVLVGQRQQQALEAQLDGCIQELRQLCLREAVSRA